jgi:DNA-binding HxlR family transcriptional regulator
MGTSLIPPLQELCRWAKANVRRRDEARERFDHLQNIKS